MTFKVVKHKVQSIFIPSKVSFQIVYIVYMGGGVYFFTIVKQHKINLKKRLFIR